MQLVPAVKAAMAKLPPDTPFYSIAKLDHTMPFYLGHTMIMVQQADELRFGVETRAAEMGADDRRMGRSAGRPTATRSR